MQLVEAFIFRRIGDQGADERRLLLRRSVGEFATNFFFVKDETLVCLRPAG